MAHFLFLKFFKSYIKNRSVSKNGPSPFSKISKISKKIKKIEIYIFQYFKNFSRVVFYPDSEKVVSVYFGDGSLFSETTKYEKKNDFIIRWFIARKLKNIS